MLALDDLPQLRQLLWSRRTADVTEAEAFELYETNRGWVDPASMSERERAFFDGLVAKYGNGVFLG